jgi:small subunit ribosomal protein S15
MNKAEIVAQFGTTTNDTGSPEVQCAILTEKINLLTIHLKANKKDFQTRRGLITMVTKRKRLLSYLQKKDSERYKVLMVKLNLSKN